MMTTRFLEGLRARPLEARADRDESVIWFLTDRRAAKDDEIEAFPEICLTFVYPKEKVYLSISGQASVGRDTERARSLWNEQQQVWWPGGPSDPNVLVIQFSPKRAEIWDGPASSAVAACEFGKARATGRKPNLGEKRKSTVKLNWRQILSVTVFEAALGPMIGASIVVMDHELDPPLVTLMVGVGIPLSFLIVPARWHLLSSLWH
jgi:general stress protein 26